jgi:hypothetical protein
MKTKAPHRWVGVFFKAFALFERRSRDFNPVNSVRDIHKKQANLRSDAFEKKYRPISRMAEARREGRTATPPISEDLRNFGQLRALAIERTKRVA